MDKATDQTGKMTSASLANTPTPVRSAKEAINAMYAQDPEKRLSNYLANSAKEIINANGRGSAKSAANLHRGSIQHQMEARPSASGLLRTAKAPAKPQPKAPSGSMDPLAQKSIPAPAVKKRPQSVQEEKNTTVVKTSLKLAPKRKAPVQMAPSRQARRVRTSDGMINSPKGQSALAKVLAQRKARVEQAAQPAQMNPAAGVEETLRVVEQARRKALGQPEPVAVKRKRKAPHGLMQDIVRPRPPRSARPTNEYPADSVRHRFQTAPKGYTAQATVQEESYVGYEDELSANQKPPVDIYGMMDEEPTGSDVSNLGVVEDYRPQGDTVSEGINEQKVAGGSGKAAPDNHKYALGGQSPFFLKTVNVEKRPLSDGPRRNDEAPEGTLYEKPSTEPLGKKNVYVKEAAPKKTLPSKPTVIIPASRRSKAPLICLLLLTVVLGAAVGAFIYLCFFQYME